MTKAAKYSDVRASTNLATDVQSDGEFSPMRQTHNSQEVSEIRTVVCEAADNKQVRSGSFFNFTTKTIFHPLVHLYCVV